MQCERCENGRSVTRLLNICAACPKVATCRERDRDIENPSNSGRSFVSIDAYPDRDMPLERRIRPYAPSRDERHTQLPLEVEERLRDELAGFLRLSFMNQMLLVWILRGGTLSDFARMDWLPKRTKDGRAAIARQTVAEHVETLKKACPRIAGVIQDMIALNSPCGSRKNARRKHGKHAAKHAKHGK